MQSVGAPSWSTVFLESGQMIDKPRLPICLKGDNYTSVDRHKFLKI